MFEDRSDAQLLEAMSQAQLQERSAFARQLMAVGALTARRAGAPESEERDRWCVDGWEATAAEIGAELGISRSRASSHMKYGIDLCERFPKLAAVFVAGQVDFRVIAAAIFRTALIQDGAVLAAVDTKLAARAPAWNKRSRDKITELVDWLVLDLDPDALRIARQRDIDRHVQIRPAPYGTAEIWGQVRAPDAAAFDATLNALAATVCPNDPRTTTQRRADAVGALAARATTMACACDCADCPLTPNIEARNQIVITVLADAATLTGASDKPGYLPGYGALPAATLRELAGTTARLRLLPPAGKLGAEPRYRPSAALTRFIRCRDLTCRWPGCDKPATACDIDHSVPYPFGLTHPSNNVLYCRVHHLLKTFYTGPGGWSVDQHADGTLTFTSPSQRTYTTTPAGALFFPQLAQPTPNLILPNPPPPTPDRCLAMPTRKRTRTQDRNQRIAWERALNHARYAADPPPF